jgi:hypothetical protein
MSELAKLTMAMYPKKKLPWRRPPMADFWW